MANTRMKAGHWYRMNDRGEKFIGQYVGTEQGFPCCVCDKGCRAKVFNVWYDKEGGYESWGFGPNHMPELLEDLGDTEEIILNEGA